MTNPLNTLYIRQNIRQTARGSGLTDYLMLGLLAILLCSCTFQPSTKFDKRADRAEIPQDEAPHIKNSLEWWYFTGHLQNEMGREYGVEYVFFHFNPFGKNDYMMVNFALTDPQDSTFYYDYKIVKKKELLKNQLPINFLVSKKGQDWKMTGQEGSYVLSASMANKNKISMNLATRPSKPVLLHAGTGYERYGEYAEAGYYSFPRLSTEGILNINGNEEVVKGELWYDRQWNCIGVWNKDIAWDWMSIQLNEVQEEIMVYSLHHNKDSVDVVGGSHFSEQHENTSLTSKDVSIEALEFWTSPVSKKLYPVKWRVMIPGQGYDLVVAAIIPHQELKLKVGPFKKLYYWEGMCNVVGTKYGQAITGKSYVEITNR